MQVTEARELTSRMSYKPGWTISGHGYSGCGGEVFYVAVEFEAPHSDVYYAPGYRKLVDVQQETALDLDDYATAEEFISAVFRFVVSVEVHEASEFFAVADDAQAHGVAKPFHAHTEAGMLALDAMEPLSFTGPNIVDDYLLNNAKWRAERAAAVKAAEQAEAQRQAELKDAPAVESIGWLLGMGATSVETGDDAVSVSHV